MADIHSKKTRSYNMSRIRGTDTAPEMTVRKYLHGLGFRFRLHNKKLPGRPDLTLSKYKTVIFVNGCFWHGHKGCRYFVIPKTRTRWWNDKILATINRDQKAKQILKSEGWKPYVIWECQLRKEKRAATLNKLQRHLNANALAIYGEGEE